MKRIFLVSLTGEGVHTGYTVLGFISSNDKDIIANFIKNHYNLTLGKQYPPKFTFEMGEHWEYATNDFRYEVHVDIVYSLEK